MSPWECLRRKFKIEVLPLLHKHLHFSETLSCTFNPKVAFVCFWVFFFRLSLKVSGNSLRRSLPAPQVHFSNLKRVCRRWTAAGVKPAADLEVSGPFLQRRDRGRLFAAKPDIMKTRSGCRSSSVVSRRRARLKMTVIRADGFLPKEEESWGAELTRGKLLQLPAGPASCSMQTCTRSQGETVTVE